MRTHEFYSDGARDAFGLARCVHCGLPKSNRVHVVPDVSEEDVSDRIVGEGDGGDNE